MMMIEISESKKHKLEEHIENALHEMGKAMACVEQFGHDAYGARGRYGMGYRHEPMHRDMDDMWDDDDMMHERRRRRDSRGRYM